MWDFSRPVLPTVDALDDRPYLTAHGDGVVHLLMNQGYDTPTPPSRTDPFQTALAGAHMWVFTSTDAGLTWGLGAGIPGETFCGPAASPADDRTLTVACHRGGGPGGAMTIYRSSDQGASFHPVWVTNYTNGPGYLTPWAAMD